MGDEKSAGIHADVRSMITCLSGGSIFCVPQ
jgi:hypothetical protein